MTGKSTHRSAGNIREKDGKVPVRFYEDKLLPLYKLYSLESVLEGALNRKVWLKSGGFLVIEQTEAFVSIDVNTGKFSHKKEAEKPSEKSIWRQPKKSLFNCG